MVPYLAVVSRQVASLTRTQESQESRRNIRQTIRDDVGTGQIVLYR